VFSVAFAFFDVRLYKGAWFMPAATGLLTAVIGYVYQSSDGWSVLSAACYGTEVYWRHVWFTFTAWRERYVRLKKAAGI
jgi:stage II sporulation protein E